MKKLNKLVANLFAKKTLNDTMLKKAGFTVIEFAVVVGLIATGILITVMANRGNSDKQYANQMVSDVSQMASGIKSIYASSSGGYATLSATNAISAGIVPSDLKNTGTAIQNQWSGGAVAMSGTATNYTITYTGVSAQACTLAVSALLGSGNITGILMAPATAALTAATADGGTIATQCKAATSIAISAQ